MHAIFQCINYYWNNGHRAADEELEGVPRSSPDNPSHVRSRYAKKSTLNNGNLGGKDT